MLPRACAAGIAVRSPEADDGPCSASRDGGAGSGALGGGASVRDDALVAASCVTWVVWHAKPDLYLHIAVIGPLHGDWWKLFTNQFAYLNGMYAFLALLTVAIFGWLLERRHGPAVVLALFFGAGATGALVASAVYSDAIVSGGNGAALALLAAWAAPDLEAARVGADYEGDLLGPARSRRCCWRSRSRARRRAGWRGSRARRSGLRSVSVCTACASLGTYDGREMTMTNAVVLIEAERDALSSLGGALADIEGVAEAYSVTGEWDFVAIVRVPDHEQLADVVTGQIGGLPGVVRTQTMVAFAAYSRHDLESLFSIGE